MVALSGTAHAEPVEPGSSADLDGVYLALGPQGGAARAGDGWTGTFGAEVMLVRVRERRPVAALGLTAGAARFSETERGRLWIDLLAATRRPLGVAIGVEAGPVVEVDELRPPRAGAQASIWVYAGIVPYLRFGTVDKSGSFIEIGARLPLPAVRW